MRQYLFVCLVVLISSIDISFSKDAALETVSKHGHLKVDGINLLNQQGEKVQLKGMGIGWSIWWPYYYNKATVDGIHTLCHSNVVRPALSVETSDGGYLKDPEGQMALIEAVIEGAIKDDIYVLVDWHEVSDEIHLAAAKDFFDKVSKKYGRYANIIYETYNEPTTQTWSGVMKPYHEEIIKTIRANDPDNIIILGTPQWSQKVDDAAADPITDQINIMYTLHFYAGTHKQWLRDTAKVALDKGLPIFVTEYGTVNADASGPVDLEESKLWWDFLDEYNISYINYAIADKDEAASVFLPGTTAEDSCKPEFLSEAGKLAVAQNTK